jgi:hypothetical protein
VKFLNSEEQHVISEIQQWPFVILESARRTHSGDLLGLKMKNIGNSAAINIRVGNNPDSAAIPSLDKGETCLLRIPPTFSLANLPILTLVDDEYNLFLDPTSARAAVVLKVKFQNIQMQPYFVETRIALDGCKILHSGRIEGRDM